MIWVKRNVNADSHRLHTDTRRLEKKYLRESVCHLRLSALTFITLFLPLLTSCQTAQVPQAKTENQQEAISAIHSVVDALSTKTTIIKYCPIDGKHYAPHLKMCPEHEVLLKETEE